MLSKTKGTGKGKIGEITGKQVKLTGATDSGSVHANVERRG
jgi:hypothetical protein